MIDQSTWRYTLAVPILLLAIGLNGIVKRRNLRFGDAKTILLLLGQGFIVFLASFALVGAIALGTRANVVGFLANISPIFTLVLSRLFFKERIGLLKSVATLVSVVGAALLILGSGSTGFNLFLKPGALVGISSSLFFGIFVITNGRFSLSRGKIDSYPILLWTFIGAALSSLIFSLGIFGILDRISPSSVLTDIAPPITTYQWELLAGFALLSTAIPYMLLTLGEESVRATTASIIYLVAPISNVILSIFILNEFLNGIQIFGCALVIGGIAAVSYKSRDPTVARSADL